jgi:hypothetical protein
MKHCAPDLLASLELCLKYSVRSVFPGPDFVSVLTALLASERWKILNYYLKLKINQENNLHVLKIPDILSFVVEAVFAFFLVRCYSNSENMNKIYRI